MASTIRYKKIPVQKKRNARNINIAQKLIPVAHGSDDRDEVNVLFHKSLSGHTLISLNRYNKPVAAWRDMDGIVPIKSQYVKDPQDFRKILDSLNPKIVYLNDGELLAPLDKYPIEVYSNKTLLNILSEINIVKDDDESKVSTRNNYKLSYSDMKELIPEMTRKEYHEFCRSLSKS